MGDLLEWIVLGLLAFLLGFSVIMICPLIAISIDWIIDGRVTIINMHEFVSMCLFALRAGLPMGSVFYLLAWLEE